MEQEWHETVLDIVLVDDCVNINAEERIQFFGINIMFIVIIVCTEKLIPFSLIYEYYKTHNQYVI